jgi:hypothetical protein
MLVLAAASLDESLEENPQNEILRLIWKRK